MIATLLDNESAVQQFLERKAFIQSMEASSFMHQVITAMDHQDALISVLPPKGPDRKKLLELVSGRTPLVCAVEIGHTGVIQLLLQYNEDINERDEVEGKTALHRAVESGNEEIIKLLLQSDADVEVADLNGHTPLCLAAAECQLAAVELLLKSNANVHVTNNKGRTPLALVIIGMAPEQETFPEKARIIQRLVENGSDIETRDEDGLTPLLTAACIGVVGLMEPLLKHGADVDARGPKGETALFSAITWGNEEMAKLLLNYNANVNHYANFNTFDSILLTPLELTLSLPWDWGKRRVVEILLENGADLLERRGNFELSILGKAIGFGNLELTKLVLDHGGDIEQGRIHFPPLCFAAYQRQEGIVQLLIERGESLQRTDGRYGRNALSWAASRGNTAVFNRLLQTPGIGWDDADRIGRTPLFYAAVKGHDMLFKQLRLLGSDIHRQDRFGLTPLIVAVQHGHRDLIRQILDNHPLSQEPQDRFGRSLSWWIRATGNTWIRDLLIRYGMRLGDAQMGQEYSSPVKRAGKSSHECDVCTLPLSGKNRGREHGAGCEKYRICSACDHLGAKSEDFTQRDAFTG